MPSIPRFSATVLTDRPAEVAAFYADTFALEVVTDIGWFRTLRDADGGWELCVWDSGHESVPAMVRPGVAGAGPVLAFVVDDVDAIAARVGADPTTIVDEPWGQRHVFVQDPAGTVIDVVQVTTPDPAWLAAHGLAEEPSPTT